MVIFDELPVLVFAWQELKYGAGRVVFFFFSLILFVYGFLQNNVDINCMSLYQPGPGKLLLSGT